MQPFQDKWHYFSVLSTYINDKMPLNSNQILKDKYRILLFSIPVLFGFLYPNTGFLISTLFVSDKEAHFLFFLYFTLYLTIEHNGLYKPALLSFVVGITIECLQSFLPGRSFDFNDILTNSIGIIVALITRYGFEELWRAITYPDQITLDEAYLLLKEAFSTDHKPKPLFL